MRTHYQSYLKPYSRELRKNSTDAERKLWQCIRRKQIEGIQFYRQRPVGNYIIDFVSFTPKIAIELDGSQHFEEEHRKNDEVRDAYLRKIGFTVLRYSDTEVLKNIDGVLEQLYQIVKSH